MPEKVQTLGEFIDLIKQTTTNRKGKVWIERLESRHRREMGEDVWKDWRNHFLIPWMVIKFAEWIAEQIIFETECCSMKAYNLNTLEHGHAFLEEIHQKAVEQGIEADLEKIELAGCTY